MEQTGRAAVAVKDALETWDAGEPLSAFMVETTGDRQVLVYAAAFEELRASESGDPVPDELYAGLTTREADVAKSIAHVAADRGWARMVAEHLHAKSPAITLVNPNPRFAGNDGKERR